ncbi:MAG: hypothetical protein LBJ19_00425 [Holosporaceae bacterium]|nr:hypothetical protein [Holosporaceae bacterium]
MKNKNSGSRSNRDCRDDAAAESNGNSRCHCKCKTIGIVSAVAMILICATAEHFYNANYSAKLNEYNKKEILQAVATCQESYGKQLESLSAKFNQMCVKLHELQSEKSKAFCCECGCRNATRERWKVWIALRTKLEAEEPADEELKVFNVVFAGDDELVKLVAKLINGVNMTSPNGDKGEKLLDTCKQYLSKVVRIKKIDHRELSKISGYVLSSIEKRK